MNKIESINYKENPLISTEIEKLIQYKLKQLFPEQDQSDLFEYIKIITSNEYN